MNRILCSCRKYFKPVWKYMDYEVNYITHHLIEEFTDGALLHTTCEHCNKGYVVKIIVQLC